MADFLNLKGLILGNEPEKTFFGNKEEVFCHSGGIRVHPVLL